MASPQDDKITNTEAFGERPSDFALNQIHPETEIKDECQETPGKYKLIDKSIKDIVKTLDNAPPLSDLSVDDKQLNGVKPEKKESSISYSNMSRSSAFNSGGCISEAEAYSQFLASLPEYNMFAYSALNNLDMSQISQLEAGRFNIRTTSLNEDNMSWCREETFPKSHKDDGGPSAAAGGGVAAGGAGGERCSCSRGSSSGAVSSMPSDDTLLRDLSVKIILMLQYKLETNIGAGWQDLTDLHGWNYSRIKDFENHCKATNKSPFQSILCEKEFQMYTLGQLKRDLERLPRKDVLCALNEKMQEVYS